MALGAEIIIVAKMNPRYPNPGEHRHRFDKTLSDVPWSQAVAATIYLDDPVWEVLGYPKELRVAISADGLQAIV